MLERSSVNTGRAWTGKQCDLLRALIMGDVPSHEIARQLGRTEAGVQAAARRLGLSAPATNARPEPDSSGPERGSVNAQIAARIRKAASGRSNGRIGQLTGTHPETVRRYLAGRSRMPAEFVARLARALGVPIETLLWGESSRGDAA